MKKYSFLKILGLSILVYLIYQGAVFLILDFQITSDKEVSKIKLSEMINISEKRVEYKLNDYIRKDFVGFNAIIDKKYFITVTKLGKVHDHYEILQTHKKLSEEAKFNFFAPSCIEDRSGRYIDLNKFPFDIEKVYYQIREGHVYNINKLEFYEIEAHFALFNISFRKEDNRDFGYAGYQGKQSVSFICYKGNLYVLNLIPISSASYKSLHSLSNTVTEIPADR